MKKIPVNELIKLFEQMLAEHWNYEDNAEEYGKVDCSGAFVWAFRQFDLSIPHGSNRIERTKTIEMIPIENALPGMAAFKKRSPGDEHYDLPYAYQPGGQYYDGDLNDYYHIGLVSRDPNYILNARSTKDGFVLSPASDGWYCAGYLTDVDYNDAEPDPVPMPGDPGLYRVFGGGLKLRKGPGKHYETIKTIPDGSEVDVKKVVENGQWAYLKHGRESGYSMMQFLAPIETQPEEPGTEDEELLQAWNEFTQATLRLQEALDKAGLI